MNDLAENWGPWSPALTDAERRRAILVLKTLASIICGRQSPLYKALLRADAAAEDAAGARHLALLEAAIELDRLPALRRRQLISSYAGNMLVHDGETPKRKHTRKDDAAERKGAAA